MPDQGQAAQGLFGGNRWHHTPDLVRPGFRPGNPGHRDRWGALAGRSAGCLTARREGQGEGHRSTRQAWGNKVTGR